MNGEWIGNRWCGYGSNAERNRLNRKHAILLQRQMGCRSAARVRLFCAYGNAADIVAERIAELDQHRLAA
jgi:hypothetical protein